MTVSGHAALPVLPRTAVFERVVCGIDETSASLEAVRQAARLREPDGALHLLAAVYLAGAVAAGWSPPRIAEALEREAGEALRRALRLAGPATSRLVNGPAAPALLSELERERGTLVCVGTHGLGRAEGILFGSVATTMLHSAPCSVLVARPPTEPARFPCSIVVGVDGSPESKLAAAAAARLQGRFGAALRGVAAYGGQEIDFGAVAETLPDVALEPTPPVEALVEAARAADLLVVGSRGLHGLRSLGSVSEQVAHEAACSVLVVRTPLPPA